MNGPFDQVLQVFLIDNSMPDERTVLLSRKEMLTWLGSAAGPILGLLLVNLHEDTAWSVPLLENVLCAGFFGYLLVEPAVLLLRPAPLASCTASTDSRPLPDWTQEVRCGLRKQWLVPIWTDVAWAGTQIAGSLSLKYVPLFFRKDFNMSPSGLMLLRVVENLSLAAMNWAAPAISKTTGRAWAAIFFISAGSLWMLGVASLRNVWLVSALFVLRTAFARANVPFIQSIIFEAVLPRHRGRWTAVTSFKSATNGAGAWVGGFLADRTGDYRLSFALTAGMQLLCAVSLIPIAFMVPP